MSAEKSVTLGISEGAECIICEKDIQTGDRIIEVNVKIPMIITSISKRVEVHMDCAKDLRDLIDKRLKEAKSGR